MSVFLSVYLSVISVYLSAHSSMSLSLTHGKLYAGDRPGEQRRWCWKSSHRFCRCPCVCACAHVRMCACACVHVCMCMCMCVCMCTHPHPHPPFFLTRPQTLLPHRPPPGHAHAGLAYEFEQCFGTSCTQDELFERCGIKDLLQHVCDGYSATALAYGPTGSGKTFTVAGKPQRFSQQQV
jgi:hypothetical protein